MKFNSNVNCRDGDVYAALRDCHTTVQLDPSHFKAHFRLARCLFELKQIPEARGCLELFRVTKVTDGRNVSPSKYDVEYMLDC